MINNINSSKIFCVLIGFIFIILCLGTASATTVVAGKIYNADYSGVIADATITVECNSNFLNTISLNDGTYAVGFDESECSEGGEVKVSVEKGDLVGSDTGVIVECEDESYEADYFAILNIIMKPKTGGNTGGGGGGGGSSNTHTFYLCGNSKCDTGETIGTCPEDCSSIKTLSGENNEELNEAENIKINPLEEKQNFVSKITGAIVGTLGPVGSIVVFIFLVVIVCFVIAIIITKK